MDQLDALEQMAKMPLSQLIMRNPAGGFSYASCVHVLMDACLADFDDATYRAYVDKGDFRQELLDLKEGKKSVDAFSRTDLQLFLKIQQKAEDFAAGQIAAIIMNTVLLKVARKLLAT